MTKLYDRTRDGVSLDEVERVVFELLRMGVVEDPLCYRQTEPQQPWNHTDDVCPK